LVLHTIINKTKKALYVTSLKFVVYTRAEVGDGYVRISYCHILKFVAQLNNWMRGRIIWRV